MAVLDLRTVATINATVLVVTQAVAAALVRDRIAALRQLLRDARPLEKLGPFSAWLITDEPWDAVDTSTEEARKRFVRHLELLLDPASAENEKHWERSIAALEEALQQNEAAVNSKEPDIAGSSDAAEETVEPEPSESSVDALLESIPNSDIERARDLVRLLIAACTQRPFVVTIERDGAAVSPITKPDHLRFSRAEDVGEWLVSASFIEDVATVLRRYQSEADKLVRLVEAEGLKPGDSKPSNIPSVQRLMEAYRSVGTLARSAILTIANEAVKLRADYQEWVSRRPALSARWLPIVFTLGAGIAFIGGVILPMLFSGVPKAIYVGVPVAFYIAMIAFGVGLSIRTARST